MIIAVDGPAASGKSTLARRLADELGYLYFDTGVMYRAVTLASLEQSIDIMEEGEVTQIATTLDLDVRPPTRSDGRQYDVLMNGKDITWAIRSAEVDQNVSQVSIYRGVREAMTKIQRQIGLRGNVVMAGRDIGTVVLPEADLKIYLDASVEARAQRRYDELEARGEVVDLDEILEGMRDRDHLDSTRAIAPLRPAEDAIMIDSTSMDLDQVLAHVLSLAKHS